MSWLSTLWDTAKGALSGAWDAFRGRTADNVGSTIGTALANAVGPLISSGSQYVLGNQQREDQAAQAAQQQAANLAAQREFAQYGMRWKVEDAKQAGLSPLLALGGSGAAFAPNPISISAGPDMAQIGQNLGRAAQAMTSTVERQVQQLQLETAAASIQKDRAMAGYYDSLAARARQESTPGVPSGVLDSELQPGDFIQPSGAIVRPLSASRASDYWHDVDGRYTYGPGASSSIETRAIPKPGPSYKTPGEAIPLWTVFQAGPGFKIDLPGAKEGSEAVESLESPTLQAFVLAHNIKEYGPSWAANFLGSATFLALSGAAKASARSYIRSRMPSLFKVK